MKNIPFDANEHSHQRLNILTNEWVIVSPHRGKRPWQGKTEESTTKEIINYDPSCYLCPTNTRINGEENPDYSDCFIFQNDFAALGSLDLEDKSENIDDLLIRKTATGLCKVVCYSPNHSLTLAQLPVDKIKKVVDAWQQQFNELATIKEISYVQIFENKGEIMGCSNPHPHGQIWAQNHIPNEVLKKDKQQQQYIEKHQKTLLSDYLELELKLNERILYQNNDFVVLVPYWATWPFETMILPTQAMANISLLNETQKSSFADAIATITQAYDKLFDVSFPYCAGIHQCPTETSKTVQDYAHWHWHMSFYPPLLRSATVKKFMVGYEMFGMPQRDITPEMAANMLLKLI